MVKVLICGDIAGKADVLLERVTKVNSSKHGPFDVLLSFNGGDQRLKDLPIPAYVVGNGKDDGKLHFLGTSGVKKDLFGLTIAFVSNGHELVETAQLEEGEVDILLTDQYYDEQDFSGDCMKLKPKYHFCTSSPAFQNRVLDFGTRFIALPMIQDKEKYLHALSLEPTPPKPRKQPRRPEQHQQQEEPQQYFFNLSSDQKNRPNKKRRRKLAPREDCWFCLASPGCQTHLIVSVAEDAFVSLPKGGISAQHVQIIPVAHEPYLAAAPEEVLDQIAQYKQSLIEFYDTFGCIAFFCERYIELDKAMQTHAFLECIPLPKQSAEAALEQIGSAHSTFEFEDFEPGLKGLPQKINQGQQYIYIEINGKAQISVFPDDLSLEVRKKIPLQYARQVACQVLQCPQRTDWKDCIVPTHVENDMASQFKQQYAQFDPFNKQ